MKSNLLISLVLVLSGSAVKSLAVDSKDFRKNDIDAIWSEMWKSEPDVNMPTADSLSQRQVIDQMTGNWCAWMGPDKDLIFLETNGQVSISGNQGGKEWKKYGEWKVVSNKLVLFMPEDDIPGFIFRKDGKPYIFNPGANTLMSEMQRATVSSPSLSKNVKQPRPVFATNGKISKVQVRKILRSMDDELLEKNAAAVVAPFASNAVITATIVEEQRTDISTNDPDSYRRGLEAGFKEFDNCSLQREDISVEISPNGREATSISTIVESYDFEGNAQKAITRESDEFKIIDGEILITRMDSKGIVK